MEETNTYQNTLGEQNETPQIDFLKYLRGIWKRKWIPPLFALLGAVPFYISAPDYVPLYRAEVTIKTQNLGQGSDPVLSRNRLVDMRSRRFVARIASQTGSAVVLRDSVIKKFDDIFDVINTTEDPVAGYYAIEIDELDTYRLYQYNGGETTVIDSANVWEAVSSIRSVNGINFQLSPDFIQHRGRVRFVVLPFSRAMNEIGKVKDRLYPTGVLLLQLEGTDPEVLAAKLNRIADIYVQEILNLKTSDENRLQAVLEKKLKNAEEKVKEVEAELRDFRQRYPLSLDAEKEKFVSELTECRTALDELPKQRERLSKLLEQLDKDQDVSDPRQYRKYIVQEIANYANLRNEPEMVILRQTLQETEDAAEKLRANFPRHQSLLKYNSKIDSIQQLIIEFASGYRNTLAESVAEYRQKLKTIEAKLQTLPRDESHLLELERVRRVNERLYTDLLAELNNLEVSDVASHEEVAILDPALPPGSPYNASKNQKILLGGGVGFILGLLICIALEFLDKSIRTPEDIEKYLGLNVLGAIPVVDFKNIPEYHDFEKVKQIDRQLVTHDYSPTPIGESYRALRTHLMFSKKMGKIQTLLLTSISPEEGKSFTASNLSIIMAQQRTNTLLVDADLRRGVLHNTFGLAKSPGFTNYLTNNTTLSSIVKPTHIPNLSLVSCGPMIPNPSELLGSLQLRRFFEETRRKFDLVIFDTPPLDAATDAVVLGSQVDAVAVIVRAGKTNYSNARVKLEIFDEIPAHLIGVILNGSETALLKNYYSYYHY